MLEWAHRVYLWVREQTPDFGFLADGLGLEGFFAGTCETCGIADLLHLAIVLTEAGLGEYWDDIERFTRNQLLENQYRDPAALRRAFPGISDRVLAMLWGGFECAAYPNDLLTWNGAEGCCIGGGLRALYLSWRAAVTETEHETRVNLGFSRPTPFVEVVGYEPRAGRIEVRVRSPRRVLIRAPEHVALNEVRAFVDRNEANISWHGRYAIFDDLKPGQTATITYPLHRFSRTYQIAGKPYQGEWLGNTMIEIFPPGSRYPIYRRREQNATSDVITELIPRIETALIPSMPPLW